MDAFFASVEQHDHPEWRGKPVVVGSPPDKRGVVAACSYEARAFGIHSAMPSREAARRCPHAVFAPVNGKRYHDISRQVFAILARFTPYVEPLSVDEAFLDVTGALRFFGPPAEIARKIKETILGETGLVASVGVASNKFLAKLASDMCKPDGLRVMPDTRAEIVALLAPMPATRIWGIGEVTGGRLAAAGYCTIGDLQRSTQSHLASIVGEHAASHILRLAWGEDARTIETGREEQSISREVTFPADVESSEQVESTILDLTDDVGRQLREAGFYAGLARLKLRWHDFKTISRQMPLSPACCDDFALRRAALELVRREAHHKPVRLVGFGVSRLTGEPSEQLDLFGGYSQHTGKRESLSRTVDAIRRKFGENSIKRGKRGKG
jgi:DNA polymerase-4